MNLTNKKSRIVRFACFLASQGCYVMLGCTNPGTKISSEVKSLDSGARISGRLSMGDFHNYQCQPYQSYSSAEQVNGRWIVGIDGKSFGSLYDADTPPSGPLACNSIFTITYQDKCENFIVMDRIWENDGVGGQTYSDFGDSVKKINSRGPGYTQIDIAKRPFQSLFAGHNPSGGYQINSGATCPSGGVVAQSPSLPATNSPGMQGALPPIDGAPGREIGNESNGGFFPGAGIGSPNSTGGSGIGMPTPTATQSPGATTPPQLSPPTADFPSCVRRDYCSGAWGWHTQGESGCNAGTPGWIQDKNGCSCRC